MSIWDAEWLSRWNKKRRSSRREVFCKKSVLKIFENVTGKHFARVSFLIKLQAEHVTLLKKTLAQVFSCEFCDIFKNTVFFKTPPVAASENCNYGVIYLWHPQEITNFVTLSPSATFINLISELGLVLISTVYRKTRI